MKNNFFIVESETPNAHVWDVNEVDEHGKPVLGGLWVTFNPDDLTDIRNLWTDYPEKFTPEEIEILKNERSYWTDFFANRNP